MNLAFVVSREIGGSIVGRPSFCVNSEGCIFTVGRVRREKTGASLLVYCSRSYASCSRHPSFYYGLIGRWPRLRRHSGMTYARQGRMKVRT